MRVAMDVRGVQSSVRPWEGTMRRGTPPSNEEDAAIEAAASLLGAFGPVDGGVKVRVAAVEAHLGISRTTVYRMWPSMKELTADLVLHAATARDSWYQRVLRTPPERGIRAALAGAIRPDDGEPGTRFRAIVATWPRADPSRLRVASWEWAWLERFARWLGQALRLAGVAPRDGVTLDDLAILAAGVVEGQVLLDAVRASPSAPRPDPHLADHIAQSVELMLWAATVPLDRDHARPRFPRLVLEAPAAPTDNDDRQDDALDALLDADRCDRIDRGGRLFTPTRLVDESRLARRLDLTPRGVRMRWPSAAAFNGELIEHLIQRQLEASEAVALDWVPRFLEAAPAMVSERDLGARNERYLDLAVPLFDEIVRIGFDASHGHALAVAAASLDEEVAARARTVIDERRNSSLLLFRAIFQAAELHLRPALDPEVYIGPLHGAALGFQRVALLHPALVDRQVDLGSRTHPIFGFGYFAVYHGMACDAVNDGRPHEHEAMPTLTVLAPDDDGIDVDADDGSDDPEPE